MDELIVQGEINSKILVLRGKQVMLDRDLVELYNMEHFNEEDFMFVSTKEEFKNLRSQIGTANFSKTRALPYAFTE